MGFQSLDMGHETDSTVVLLGSTIIQSLILWVHYSHLPLLLSVFVLSQTKNRIFHLFVKNAVHVTLRHYPFHTMVQVLSPENSRQLLRRMTQVNVQTINYAIFLFSFCGFKKKNR
ncbi:MAG: hypothetical protein CVV50_00485 [Spirochaetae bacterium HGW-Spirochaetae-6]|nr:MAG: hypothetical protein CVV50_00485 [Spirochaetae bacterium HGW-Spirochaetae-6]